VEDFQLGEVRERAEGVDASAIADAEETEVLEGADWINGSHTEAGLDLELLEAVRYSSNRIEVSELTGECDKEKREFRERLEAIEREQIGSVDEFEPGKWRFHTKVSHVFTVEVPELKMFELGRVAERLRDVVPVGRQAAESGEWAEVKLDARRRLDVQFLECFAKTTDWIEVNERPVEYVQATDRPRVKKLEIT
jgi:hypothetical protein